MAEISSLVLLPAVTNGRPVTPVRSLAGRQSDPEDSAYLARVDSKTDTSSDATSNNDRAKQFRFRVVDGGRSDTLGNAELPSATRQKTTQQAIGEQALGCDITAGSQKQIPPGTFSAPFLAQLIAQEQLQPGLYDPPIKQADRAYRLAGAQPALNDPDNGVARFKIAV